MNGSAKRRPPILQLQTGLSWRLDLRAAPAPVAPPPSRIEVREIGRDQIATVLGAYPALNRPADRVDLVAPAGWRCFVAFDDGVPVHVNFVELRPNKPLLFGGITDPVARRRGAFRATLQHMVAQMREAGEVTLYSSTARDNEPSVHVHRQLGFQVYNRPVDVWVLGVSLRRVAGRVLRGLGLRSSR